MAPRYRCGQPVERATPAERLARWRSKVPQVQSDDDELKRALDRSAEDLGALRIFDPDYPERVVVAAGAPWFMTVFGRDSLITSWMALIVDPDLALGVLQTLARFQGKEIDPRTDEQPGRILHEMRFGEAASLSLGGGSIYYGTADATPLFVMLLGELRRWGLAPEAVDSLLPNAERALEWIDTFGDADGDGYVEYKRATDRGLANQGWKDSWDAIRYADGTVANAPIALCEVQAYVYSAYLARAHFAHEAGDEATYSRFRLKATRLKEAFNRDFWLDEQGWFAVGLDPDKRPIGLLDLEHRSLPLDRHRRRRQGPSSGRAPHVQRDVLRLGGADPRHLDGGLQPGQLSLRLGMAARHGDRRRRPRALRVQRGRIADRAGAPRRRTGARRPTSRAFQRARPSRAVDPGELPDLVLTSGLGGRVAAFVPENDPAARPVGPLRQDLDLADVARGDEEAEGGGDTPGGGASVGRGRRGRRARRRNAALARAHDRATPSFDRSVSYRA